MALRILLTGATGFIGGQLLPALLARGHEVVCAVRDPGRPLLANTGNVKYIEANFTRDLTPEAWLPRLNGIDVVINAVGILQERGAQTFEALHTRAPQALFLACEQAGVRRVIQISALGADAEATSRYHQSKKAADDLLAQTHLRWVIVQPSLVFGTAGTSARLFTLLASLPLMPVLGDGQQQVQPVHIDDVVATVMALLEPDSLSQVRVPVVGPQQVSFEQFLRVLRARMLLPRTLTFRTPMPLVRLSAALGSMIPGLMLDRETLAMLVRGNTAPAELVTSLLGRPPRAMVSFIPQEYATEVRRSAQLRWLLPIVRIALALVWIVTGIVSFGLFPTEQSFELLARAGVPALLQPLMLYGAAALDVSIGVGLLLLKRRQWLWLLQAALILGYTLIITIKLPEFWLHPYGPILKNLPILAAIVLMYELERR